MEGGRASFLECFPLLALGRKEKSRRGSGLQELLVKIETHDPGGWHGVGLKTAAAHTETSPRAGSLYPDASLGRHILLAPASVSGSASTRHITLDSSPAGLSSRSQLEGSSPPGLLGSGEGSPPPAPPPRPWCLHISSLAPMPCLLVSCQGRCRKVGFGRSNVFPWERDVRPFPSKSIAAAYRIAA